jgi:hypothetical protein
VYIYLWLTVKNGFWEIKWGYEKYKKALTTEMFFKKRHLTKRRRYKCVKRSDKKENA